MMLPREVPEMRSISRSSSKNGTPACFAAAAPIVVFPAPRSPTSAIP
jgi:hypothetical protein